MNNKSNDPRPDPDEVIKHLPLVRFVVNKMAPKSWTTFDYEDFLSYGTIGLMEALRRYDPEAGPFPAFAIPRIRGAILDVLRTNDFMSRSTRRDVRHVSDAEQRLLVETGSAPADQVERALAMTHERYLAVRQAARVTVIPLDRTVRDDDTLERLGDQVPDQEESALDRLLEKELLEEVTALVTELPQREQFILALRFKEGLTMKEIARVMGLSESRISQLQSRAIYRLQQRLHVAA